MENNNGIPTFYAESRTEWRKWLEENHRSGNPVCLIIYHKKSKTKSIYYPEAIEEALCFGWIDGKANKRDGESFYLYFAPRKPKSNWSKINKERADRMIKLGLMTSGGQALIDLAKETGTWDALTDVENIVIPEDLKVLFDKNAKASGNFEAFSPSSKRMILEWILNAKKAETRQKRINETVKLAERNIKANHPGK